MHRPGEEAAIIQPHHSQPSTRHRRGRECSFSTPWEGHCVRALCQETVCKVLRIPTASRRLRCAKGRNKANWHSCDFHHYGWYSSQLWVKRDTIMLMPLYWGNWEQYRKSLFFSLWEWKRYARNTGWVPYCLGTPVTFDYLVFITMRTYIGSGHLKVTNYSLVFLFRLFKELRCNSFCGKGG